MNGTKRLLALAAAGAAWGLYESQWVQQCRRVVPITGLDPAFDGLRIGHLSDLHVGAPSLNARSLARGVELIRQLEPDLVVVSGDLRARRSGDAALRRSLALLDAPLGAYAVLGNHDHADGHDPFADGDALADLDGTPVRLLRDETATVEVDGRADPPRRHRPAHVRGRRRRARRRTRRPHGRSAPPARATSPTSSTASSRASGSAILSGHLHGGQLCVPYPGGRFRLAHLSRDYLEGVYVRNGTAMHVSRGLGTTFVPFRFAARPEVTLLELRAA